jgi:hypothetical protein
MIKNRCIYLEVSEKLLIFAAEINSNADLWRWKHLPR